MKEEPKFFMGEFCARHAVIVLLATNIIPPCVVWAKKLDHDGRYVPAELWGEAGNYGDIIVWLQKHFGRSIVQGFNCFFQELDIVWNPKMDPIIVAGLPRENYFTLRYCPMTTQAVNKMFGIEDGHA